jgi:hypothetical protein
VEGGLGFPGQAGDGGSGASAAEYLDDAEGGFVEVAVVVGVNMREVVAGEGVYEGRVDGGLVEDVEDLAEVAGLFMLVADDGAVNRAGRACRAR